MTGATSHSGQYDGRLHVLDADADGRHSLVGSEPDPHAIIAVAFAPDGRTIAAATFNDEEPGTNHVSIWDRRPGNVVREIDDVSVVGPRVRRIRRPARDRVLRRDRADPRHVVVGDPALAPCGIGHRHERRFSPDGELLATSGEDATIRVFDTRAESGAQRLALRGHELLVSGLDFSPDGKRLASAAPDGVVRVWALDLDELIAIAEDELTRPLTDDECRQYLHLEDGCE